MVLGFARVLVGIVAALGLLQTAAEAQDKGALRSAACAQKASATEAAICLDRDLVRRDAQVAQAYAELRRMVPPRVFQPIAAEQQRWRIDRNRCGAQVPCLATSYQERLNVLEQVLRNTSPAEPVQQRARRKSAAKRSVS
jgi:uncharacterized protein